MSTCLRKEGSSRNSSLLALIFVLCVASSNYSAHVCSSTVSVSGHLEEPEKIRKNSKIAKQTKVNSPKCSRNATIQCIDSVNLFCLSVCLSLRSSACLSVLWSECFGFGLAQVVRSHTEVVCFARCRARGVRTMLWGQANSLCYRTIDKPNKSAATAELGAGGMQPLIDPQYESFELTLACKYCQRVWQLATFHRMPHKVFPAVDSAGC